MLFALDLGMHTGWALFTRAGARLASGVWHLGKDQVRGRFGELLLYLRTKVGAQGVKSVAYEHVRRHAATTAAHVFGGWLAVLDMLQAATHVEPLGLRTQDLHAAAGVTSASKRDFPDRERRRTENKRRMVAAAVTRGWAVADDNEAEACFCGIAALAKGTGASHG